VLDELVRGEEDDDEENQVVDRAYWERKASKGSLEVVDACFQLLREIAPDLGLNYNKYHIGLKARRANNFVVFRPKKSFVRIEARLPEADRWKSRLEEAGLDVMPIGRRSGRERVRFRASRDDVLRERDLVRELFRTSYDENAR
jgi:hypothetical protein